MKKTDIKKAINFNLLEKHYNLYVEARDMKERFLTDEDWVETFIDFCIHQGLIIDGEEFKYEMGWYEKDMFRIEVLWKGIWFRIFNHEHNFDFDCYTAMEELVKISKK
jgi:hypothetical protein